MSIYKASWLCQAPFHLADTEANTMQREATHDECVKNGGHDSSKSVIVEEVEQGRPGISIVDIIKKKRDSEQLTDAEIRYFVQGAVDCCLTEAQIGTGLNINIPKG